MTGSIIKERILKLAKYIHDGNEIGYERELSLLTENNSRNKILNFVDNNNLSLQSFESSQLLDALGKILPKNTDPKQIEMNQKMNEFFEKNNLTLDSLDFQDLLDALYLKTRCDEIAPEYCPPSHIRKIVQGESSLWSYAYVGAEFFTYLKLLCDLKPNHKILDLGCGCGRIATLFKYYLKEPGEYFGLDAVASLINNAKQILSGKIFHFVHQNVFSEYYNPDPNATKPENVKIPFEDNFFDTVYLVSVFTHMLPKSIKNYLKEFSRTMKPGSKCLLTAFLFQNNPNELNGNWKEKFAIKDLPKINDDPDNNYFRPGNINNPEEWVIYDLNYLKQLFEQNNLKLIRGPFYGNWSGNTDFLSHQDILVLEKL